MSRYARRTDGNHKEFATMFNDLGISYQDTHGAPGMLDFLVQTRSGRLIRLEVKIDEKEPLTDAEKITFAMFPGNCYKVHAVEQARDLIFDEGD